MQPDVIEFEQLKERGCGIDVHEKTVVATIDGKGIEKQTKTFDMLFTSSLKESKCGVIRGENGKDAPVWYLWLKV